MNEERKVEIELCVKGLMPEEYSLLVLAITPVVNDVLELLEIKRKGEK